MCIRDREYCIDGRRVINTQDIRLCRRTLQDAAARGRSPAKTLSMWDRVLDLSLIHISGLEIIALNRNELLQDVLSALADIRVPIYAMNEMCIRDRSCAGR